METFELSVSKADRRQFTHLRNKVFFELMKRGLKTHNNGEFTINMVNNWFYGKNENSTIEQVFTELKTGVYDN